MTQQAFAIEPGNRYPAYALTQFTVDELQQFWPHIDDMLDRIPHTWTCWTKSWIRESAENGIIQVWGIGPPPKAVLIFFTQVCVYPAQRILLVPWGAGSFKRAMLPLIAATLTQYAQANECSKIEVRGRPGWEPHFKSVGMRREYVTWGLSVPNVRAN